jgi:hypothetical protein
MPNLSSEQLETGLRLLLSLYAQYLGSTNNPTLQRHLLEQMAEVLAGWDLSPERLRRILPTEILSVLDTAALIPPRRRRPPTLSNGLDATKKQINQRLKDAERGSGIQLTKGARDMLRIPLAEVAGLGGELDYYKVESSLTVLLSAMAEETPESEAEGNGRIRSSLAVIRSFAKNFCNIPPFCASKRDLNG